MVYMYSRIHEFVSSNFDEVDYENPYFSVQLDDPVRGLQPPLQRRAGARGAHAGAADSRDGRAAEHVDEEDMMIWRWRAVFVARLVYYSEILRESASVERRRAACGAIVSGDSWGAASNACVPIVSIAYVSVYCT